MKQRPIGASGFLQITLGDRANSFISCLATQQTDFSGGYHGERKQTPSLQLTAGIEISPVTQIQLNGSSIARRYLKREKEKAPDHLPSSPAKPQLLQPQGKKAKAK
jgi:hypothetical protein